MSWHDGYVAGSIIVGATLSLIAVLLLEAFIREWRQRRRRRKRGGMIP